MSPLFEVRRPPEDAYRRRALFAIELVDAVTLSRVSEGVKVVADGLLGKPFVNASGLFVWLEEDFGNLRKVSIDPGALPYESVEIAAADLLRPLTTIQLSPRVDYPFDAGVTGLRGTLIEERVLPPLRPEPVRDGEVRLRWLDDDDNWQDATTLSHTDTLSGDFAAIVRLAPSEIPKLAGGAITVRLRVRRDAGGELGTADLKLMAGRVANPSALEPMIFAWDELQP